MHASGVEREGHFWPFGLRLLAQVSAAPTVAASSYLAVKVTAELHVRRIEERFAWLTG